MPDILPWERTECKYLHDYRIFKIRQDFAVSPRTSVLHDFFVLETHPWVNVIALTPSRDLIMVQQFRHGVREITLEIPGGVMDDLDKDPVEAGVRELREETGFEGTNARQIGWIHPNPAIQGNMAYTVLVENCAVKHEISLDDGEDVAVKFIPAREIPALMKAGTFSHALVMVSLSYWLLEESRIHVS